MLLDESDGLHPVADVGKLASHEEVTRQVSEKRARAAA